MQVGAASLLGWKRQSPSRARDKQVEKETKKKGERERAIDFEIPKRYPHAFRGARLPRTGFFKDPTRFLYEFDISNSANSQAFSFFIDIMDLNQIIQPDIVFWRINLGPASFFMFNIVIGIWGSS